MFIPTTVLTVILLLPSHILTKGILDFLTRKPPNVTSSLITRHNPYCSICCIDVSQKYRGRICGIHTMCAYENKMAGPACRGLIVMEFSVVEKDAILDAHNSLRNRVALSREEMGNSGPQYPASDMRLMSWDDELANVSERWAAQCVSAHDKCRDLARFPVGQNIAKGNYGSKSDLEHIADWYELVGDFDRDFVKGFDRPKMSQYAPYTQLVWADTYLIGCARVAFQTTTKGQSVYREHFICNYGPSGNIPSQPIYRVGEACSACPEGTFCTNPEFPGLCSRQEEGEGNTSVMARRRRPPKVKQLAILNSEGERVKPIIVVVGVYLYVFVSKEVLI